MEQQKKSHQVLGVYNPGEGSHLDKDQTLEQPGTLFLNQNITWL